MARLFSSVIHPRARQSLITHNGKTYNLRLGVIREVHLFNGIYIYID